MKKKVACVIAVLLCLFVVSSCVSSQQGSGKYVGSVNSRIYHYEWCDWAQKISKQNEVWFKSAEDAKSNGYRSCKVCNPPG